MSESPKYAALSDRSISTSDARRLYDWLGARYDAAERYESRAKARARQLCGGCRPLQLAALAHDAGFAVITREVVVQLGLPSEVLVVARPNRLGHRQTGLSGCCRAVSARVYLC